MTSSPAIGTDSDETVDQRAAMVESPAEELVTESLVEEVSIDGMCGVY